MIVRLAVIRFDKCMCVCVCMCIYICICMYEYMYVSIYFMYPFKCMYVLCRHKCMCASSSRVQCVEQYDLSHETTPNNHDKQQSIYYIVIHTHTCTLFYIYILLVVTLNFCKHIRISLNFVICRKVI